MKQRVLGVISDTHGLLRPEVHEAFKGVRLILHAGDIGSPEVLEGLESIAPVVAIRGNNDTERWAQRIPETRLVREGAISIYLLHNVRELELGSDLRPDVVISGHSHKPLIEKRDGMLFLNPGSAGPRRFKLPIAVGRLVIRGKTSTAEIIQL